MHAGHVRLTISVGVWHTAVVHSHFSADHSSFCVLCSRVVLILLLISITYCFKNWRDYLRYMTNTVLVNISTGKCKLVIIGGGSSKALAE